MAFAEDLSSVWELEAEEQSLEINYAKTESLRFEVCCPNHCMPMFLEASRIPKLKQLSFTLTDRPCAELRLYYAFIGCETLLTSIRFYSELGC
jgi:hypothetical protein